MHQHLTALLVDEWRTIPDRGDLLSRLVTILIDPQTDLYSVNILAYAVAAAGEDGLTELLGLLKHDDFSIRAYAAEGLGSLDNSARWAVPSLLTALMAASPGWEECMLLRAIARIGGEQARHVIEAIAVDVRRREVRDETLLEAVEYALAAVRTSDGV